MRIFNNKRNLEIQNKKLKTYILYAIGEIILIVIGIFFGLKVNTWSNENLKQKSTNNYYERINEEIDFSLELIQHNTKFSDSLINGLTTCLKNISENKIDSVVIKNLSLLTANQQQTLFFPTIDEFLDLGYLSAVNDLSLREEFIKLGYFRKQSSVVDENIQLFSENLLKPILIDKINYLAIDSYNQDNKVFEFKRLELDNHLENDYNELVSDLEIWNLLVYRINIEKDVIVNNKSLIKILRRIKEKIQK